MRLYHAEKSLIKGIHRKAGGSLYCSKNSNENTRFYKTILEMRKRYFLISTFFFSYLI